MLVAPVAERDLDHVGQAVMLDLGLAVDDCRRSRRRASGPPMWSSPITPRSWGFTGRDASRIAVEQLDRRVVALEEIRERLPLGDAERLADRRRRLGGLEAAKLADEVAHARSRRSCGRWRGRSRPPSGGSGGAGRTSAARSAGLAATWSSSGSVACHDHRLVVIVVKLEAQIQVRVEPAVGLGER